MQNFIQAYSWINIRFLLEGLWVTVEVSVVSIIASLLSVQSRGASVRQD